MGKYTVFANCLYGHQAFSQAIAA